MGLYGPAASGVDIAGISSVMQPVVERWFNGSIKVIDPHIETGAFDRVTNTKARGTPDVLWSGPARIQAVRWPNVATARQEAVSNRTVVFHIPRSVVFDPALVQEGYRVQVVDGALSPEFVGGLFVITASVNTSFAWDRRIETVMDMGAVIA